MTCFHLYSLQLFSADTSIFSKKCVIYFLPMKTEKNGSQKMLIIGPKLFFTVLHGCPNQPRIDFSYHKYVPRLICLLICGQQFLIDLMNSESLFLSARAAVIWVLQEKHLISPLMKYLLVHILCSKFKEKMVELFFFVYC